MAFLNTNCTRVPLSQRILDVCLPFTCGNPDLDEFFSKDAIAYGRQLMGKSYIFVENKNPRNIIAAFTVANASIFTNISI